MTNNVIIEKIDEFLKELKVLSDMNYIEGMLKLEKLEKKLKTFLRASFVDDGDERYTECTSTAYCTFWFDSRDYDEQIRKEKQKEYLSIVTQIMENLESYKEEIEIQNKIGEKESTLAEVEVRKMNPEKIIKIQCAICQVETNHKLEWDKNVREEDEDQGMWWETKYEVFTCQGCDNITFKTTSVNSEDLYQVSDTGFEFEEKINYYPKRNYRMIKPDLNIYHAPAKVKKIYLETIDAYNNEQQILCAIGIRATIEAICLAEGIEEESLDKQIEGLIAKDVVTKKLGEGLQENRLLGNESAHELASFGDEELSAGIKLIEAVIENHYAITDKISTLKSRKAKTQ